MTKEKGKEMKEKVLRVTGSVLLAFVLLFSLAACGGSANTAGSSSAGDNGASGTEDVSSQDTNSATAETDPLKDAVVGDVVSFGAYSWRVLAVEDGKVLLITEDNVEARAYNDKDEDTTWEQCTLRGYLNDGFITNNFSAAESQRIVLTHVINDDHPQFGTPGGNDTDDRVFLLSVDEAERYFKDDNDRMTADVWWLRSPGVFATGVAVVCGAGRGGIGGDGSISDFGIALDSDNVGVRPAMWVSK